MNNLAIINACSDLGVDVDGTSLGPKLLSSKLNKGNIYSVVADKIEKEKSNNILLKNIKSIDSFNNELYNTVLSIIQKQNFPLCLGGDHSIAIASSLASIKAHNNLGIIWFDAHYDFNTHKTTATGNIHGLPLAAITHYEDTYLTSFHTGNYYPYKNTVIVGARDPFPIYEEVNNVKDANITVFSTEDIRKHGVDEICKKAFSIASDGTNGIHISYDLDLIDPVFAPGVSVPSPDGITKNEALQIAHYIGSKKDLIKSMDLVEYNPLNDIDNITEKIALEILNIIF